MNAYKLADELDKYKGIATRDAATMLRQQADRIAELEKDFAWAKDQWNKDRICFESRRNELEKDLALKTRDRDVFGDFTLAYEKRIAELEETINACYTVQKMQAEEVYKGNDRIAELEKLLEHSVGSDCREMRYIQELENKDARIAELEKDLKKYDQLAWDDLNKSKTIWCACGDGITPDSGAKCGICASTTPQTKPLSDEEIEQIAVRYYVGSRILPIQYARAIEERHGIK